VRAALVELAELGGLHPRVALRRQRDAAQVAEVGDGDARLREAALDLTLPEDLLAERALHEFLLANVQPKGGDGHVLGLDDEPPSAPPTTARTNAAVSARRCGLASTPARRSRPVVLAEHAPPRSGPC